MAWEDEILVTSGCKRALNISLSGIDFSFVSAFKHKKGSWYVKYLQKEHLLKAPDLLYGEKITLTLLAFYNVLFRAQICYFARS